MDSISVFRRGVKEYNLYILLARGENHTVAVNSAELDGLQVGDEADLLADEVGGLIELSDAGVGSFCPTAAEA